MTLATPSLKRLRELEDQLSSLQQERDQLKQRIEAEQIQAVRSVQPLLEKINDRLKLHGFIVGIDDELIIYLAHQRDINDRRMLIYVEIDELEKAFSIIDSHVKFITTITSAFSVYRNMSAFEIDLEHRRLVFKLFSDSYSAQFIYDVASETVSAHATAVRSRMNMSFVFGDVTMTVEGMDRTTVNYSLKTVTYTENLNQIKALYVQVENEMLTVLSKLAF